MDLIVQLQKKVNELPELFVLIFESKTFPCYI